MLLSLATALALMMAAQSASSERSQAEQLARAGQTAEARDLFRNIVEQDPTDIEARLWIARLDLRLGRTEEAEAGFRSVLKEHPANVDARIGLGTALTRKGASQEALAILHETEEDAGENADLFAALARASRRAGDDQSALLYFERARTIAPSDPDIVSGFEATANAYGHSIVFDGFAEHVDSGSASTSGSLAASLRVWPRLHVQVMGRLQSRDGSSDALGGGGVLWRMARATTLAVGAQGGPDNTSLATSQFIAEVMHYPGVFELGGNVRALSFAGVDVFAASPMLAWDSGGRWRLDTRYTYSRSRFDDTNQSAGDHSVMVRETWRGWQRVWLHGVYAYGIESFEELTADRLSSLGATTVAAGVRISMPSLTAFTTTWEHQWRSNDSTVDRLTLSVVQTFP